MAWTRWLAVVFVASCLATGARAADPMKALIVDGQNNHNWKETTPVLKQLLEDTGLFAVDVATSPGNGQDMSGFRPDFSAYQVVVSNYTGDEWPGETRQALVDYVSGGGGLVIYHAANNAFAKWEEYNEMIAVGGWGGRNAESGPYIRWRDGKMVLEQVPGKSGGHGPRHDFQIVVRDQDHPITKGLPPVFMHHSDELYSWLRGPAKNVTLLATAFSSAEQRGSGEHEPMLMTIGFGKGRVFHTALGHAGEQCRSVAFIATFQRGTEWAATGEVSQGLPSDFPGPDAPVLRDLDAKKKDLAKTGEPVVLFAGKSLEHWDVIGCEAEVTDGAILLKAGNGLVQTKKRYANYTFECEWKALHPERWDSGIYFRYGEVPAGRPWPPRYQVNLRRDMEGDLVGFKEATNEVPVKPHEWNRFALTVKGTRVDLKVNGQPAWKADGIETPSGYIALQAEVPGGGQFLFRNIRITELD